MLLIADADPELVPATPSELPAADDPPLAWIALTNAVRSAFNVLLLSDELVPLLADVEDVEPSDVEVADCACATASCNNCTSADVTLDELPEFPEPDDEPQLAPGGGPGGGGGIDPDGCPLPACVADDCAALRLFCNAATRA